MVASKGDLIGVSPAFKRLLEQIDLVAGSDATVLLTGESGTGKELVARRIHNQSARRNGPYVVCDCAALAPTLFEGALFGYRRGAFTGADRDAEGYLAAGQGGTLFLDEISELSMSCQAKLLRFLEQRTFVPLGDIKPRLVDTRIIAATNRPLDRLVGEGRFRADLYFRLNVLELRIEPLRNRPEDIEPLLTYFRRLFATHHRKQVVGFTPQALSALKQWHWPGNVRELRNVVERAVVLCRGTWIHREDLPVEIACGCADPFGSENSFQQRTREFQRRLLAEALRASGGNRKEAARRLQLAPHQLKYLMAKLGMTRVRRSPSPELS